MAFGSKKLEKQDLIDAGLDPDKFSELIGKAVSKDDLASLKLELTTTVTDLIKNQFTELETKLGQRPANNNNNNNNNNNDNTNTTKTPEEEQMEYLADPTGYIKRQVGGVGIAAALEIKRMSRNAAYQILSSSLSGFKNAELKKEIDKEWEKYTPEVLVRNNGDPEVLLKSVHDMVMGRHYDEIMRDSAKREGVYNIVSPGTSSNTNTNTNNNTNNSDKRELTEAEKVQAAKFSMTPDEWLKQEDDMIAEEKNRKNAPVLA